MRCAIRDRNKTLGALRGLEGDLEGLGEGVGCEPYSSSRSALTQALSPSLVPRPLILNCIWHMTQGEPNSRSATGSKGAGLREGK
jgi:hypothetical protein